MLAITPSTAIVRIDMERDAIGANYNDYLTLIKVNNTWQVIASVYHQFEGRIQHLPNRPVVSTGRFGNARYQP